MKKIKTMFKFLFRHWKAVVGIIFLLGCSGCITTAIIVHKKLKDADYLEDWKDSDGTIIADIVYDEQKNLKYDLYLPNTNIDTPVGAMLFIHGGAWKMGKRSDMAHACKRFVKEGYVTATMQYTLVSEENKASFFDMLDDIGKCLEHIKITAAEKHHPVKAVALSGISAGGHLSMLYAYSRAETSPIPIAFVFQQVGPASFEKGVWTNHPDLDYGLAMAGSGVEMSKEDYESGKMADVVKSISPAQLIDEKSVPTIAAYGGKDELVPSTHAEKVREALEKHHVPHVFILYPNSGHFLCNDPDCAKQYRKAILDFCRKYFETPAK
ncbi:MAG: alpha/beta hydrolase [Victivallales bacterium]|nr:alpha/beta hydrolase [Victivallales bacterium]